jgi:hypothetical protein
VLELPEETRESAEAMRRVVSDQITALNELSEIITRHGKTLDLSTPSMGEPRHVAQAASRSVEPPRAAFAAAAAAEATSWSESEAAAAPAAPVRAVAEPRRANGRSERPAHAPAPARSEAPAPAPARSASRPAAPAPRPAAATGSEDDRGWVSDLLRRASRDEEGGSEANGEATAAPAAPAQVNGAPSASGPLNLVAADIAKAIDHDAAVELWERQKRGESNLFTRRLYTLQGQQTFDEIRRKYQRDGEFKTAVDRYIADFEKLLAEVGRNSKDRNATNGYLISDTGKVYTMLAHASGRFD